MKNAAEVDALAWSTAIDPLAEGLPLSADLHDALRSEYFLTFTRAPVNATEPSCWSAARARRKPTHPNRVIDRPKQADSPRSLILTEKLG
jgi:hypothetical protein